jgi:hypothetical protein
MTTTPEPAGTNKPTNADQQIGASEPVTAEDRIWQAAAAELTPARSLARIDDHAKQILTTISLVGTLLTGLGIIAGTRLQHSTPARILAIAAVATAALAVVIAWWCQLLRIRTRFHSHNLIEVKDWYHQQFRRADGVWAAGALLLAAILLATTAAMIALDSAQGI